MSHKLAIKSGANSNHETIPIENGGHDGMEVDDEPNDKMIRIESPNGNIMNHENNKTENNEEIESSLSKTASPAILNEEEKEIRKAEKHCKNCWIIRILTTKLRDRLNSNKNKNKRNKIGITNINTEIIILSQRI